MALALNERIEQGLKSVVEALQLDGVQDVIEPVQGVYIRDIPEQTTINYPCVVVSAEGEAITEEPSTFLQDWTGQPFRVEILDQMPPSPSILEARRATYKLWAEQIANDLRGRVVHNLLTNVPEAWNITVRLAANPEKDAKRKQLYRAGLVGTVHCSVARTFNQPAT